MSTMEKYKKATIKELEKIKQAILQNKDKDEKPVRSDNQVKFFKSVITHMQSKLEDGKGIYTLINPEGEEVLYSYLDVINNLQNVNNLKELIGNMNMEKVPEHIKISIFDCIFPYVGYLEDGIRPSFFDMKLKLHEDDVEEIEFEKGEE